ncbi:MAG: nucleotidyltransferase family protein [Candidatus Eremiobacteraeota bacterium]|nr:nucleotidyltransferase family protein [Candidatus Eremiobacteraeota bacterium]
MSFYASITAGGRISGEFAQIAGTDVKALARIGGRTMLDRAIDAARDGGARGVAVIGGDEVRAGCEARVERVIPESPNGAENLHAALFAWQAERTLVLCSDLPFIAGAALREFIERVPTEALGMPITSAQSYASRFPNAVPHTTKIGSERIANGSAFMFPASSAETVDALAQRFFSARKSLLRMGLLIGPRLLLRFATSTLRISDLEAQATMRLGFPVRAIRDCAPELCYDVDSLLEYSYAVAHT